MRSKSHLAFTFLLPFAGAIAGVLSVSGAARAAASCATDTDCGHGFACQVVGASGCTAPACPPDQHCDPAPPCTAAEIRECRPAACATDSDCGADLKCHEQTDTVCTAPTPAACPSGQKCEAPTPACTTTVKHVCTYKWTLPCQASSDCGSGNFTCDPYTICECSGGGSTADAGRATPVMSAASAVAPADSCSCSPSSEKHCQAPSIDCSTDTQCPTRWSCAISVAPCAISSDGNQFCPDAGPSTGKCVPPGYGEAHSGKDAALDGGLAPVAESGDGGLSIPTGSAGETTGVAADAATGGGGATGNGSTANGSTSNGAAGSGMPSSGAGTAGAASGGDDGGCSVGGAGPNVSEGAWLAMLGIGEVLRRLARRKRAAPGG